MTLGLLSLAIASAADAPAPPEVGQLRPVLAPWGAPAEFQAFAQAKGASGLATRLACQPLWPDQAQLCVRYWFEGRRRWVTEADLQSWGRSLPELVAALREASRPHLASIEEVAVVGTKDTYLRLRDGDGWSAALVLLPELVCARLKSPMMAVAAPSEGVALAWVPAPGDTERILLVGVREHYDSLPDPVSPMAMVWEQGAFSPYGQAVASPDGPSR
jgi:hypothetical protein